MTLYLAKSTFRCFAISCLIVFIIVSSDVLSKLSCFTSLVGWFLEWFGWILLEPLARAWSLNWVSGMPNNLGFCCGRLANIMISRSLASETLNIMTKHFAADALHKSNLCVVTWSSNILPVLAVPLQTSFNILMLFTFETHSERCQQTMFRCRCPSKNNIILSDCCRELAHFWPW